ncbi:hypothetical protein ID866_6374 [Astraeus odoratus]|nr:hypothetical protein ID866_6374 [Astraeus odoratus]
MALHPSRLSWFIVACHLLICLPESHAQSISTNTPVPPLQWLNITGLLQGSPAPALKYASLGYDDNTRNLIIFGGQSSSGIATSQTFLLNLATYQWSTPTAQADLPQTSPPARYMAISGYDFSSSYRNAHLVIGGKGSSGQALSDAWEFDYSNHFWSELLISSGNPPPRWGASGGRDYRTPADTSTNTTFFMSGGTDGTTMYPLNDVWEFKVTGTLSANLAENHTFGSWSSQTIGTTPGYSVNQASTVLGSSIVSVSGCNTTIDTNANCAERNAYVLDVGSPSNEIALQACPAPRYGAAMVQNSLSNFQTQVFLLLGTFNSSAWDDQGGLQKGEVAVFETQTGSWSRILPAGDPGSTGVPSFPSPREGAVALSFTEALVGSNRAVGSDTIVFGGQDEYGNYLNEVWILRAYNGSISSSNASWGGPTGDLQTGVDANGAGVTVQYLTQCAVSLATTTSTPTPTETSTPTNSQSSQIYTVSFVHKLFSPLSVALVLPATLLTRLALPSARSPGTSERNILFIYLAAFLAIVAYGLGVGGLVTSFTSISSTTSVTKRDTSSPILRTAHGIAGVALFVGLYVVIPLLCLLAICFPCHRPRKEITDNSEVGVSRANSVDTAEKLASVQQQTQLPHSSPTTPRIRQHSWGGSSFWLGSRSTEGRASSDSGSLHSASPQRGFEVLNRPARIRRASTNGIGYMDSYQRVPVAPRSLGDVDWSDRRRSHNASNSLDYAIQHGTRIHVAASGSTPNTADLPDSGPLVTPVARGACGLPSPFELCLRLFFHILVFGLCTLSLVTLWQRGPKSLFAVFLLWTVLFYITLFVLAWKGRPARSLLTTIIARLRAEPLHTTLPPDPPGSRPLSMTGTDQYLFPTDTRGPYLHHPPYRATAHDDITMTPVGPRSVETDDYDDDIDEDTRQRQIEEEMGRREVSIVTVPRRRLWVTNPS